MFGADEQSGECARVARDHQGLSSAHSKVWRHHRRHKPPLGGGRLGREGDLGPAALRGIADNELGARAFDRCLHLFGGQRHR